MSKPKSLSYQIKTRLRSMTRYGQSKHEAKSVEGQHPEGIFSLETYSCYDRQLQLFAKWAKETHGARDLKDLMPLAEPYMQYRMSQNLSPYTLKLDKAAIQKLFCREGLRINATLPARIRSGITKNRTKIKDFNMKKHADLVLFGTSTGLRRSEMLDLQWKDIDPETLSVTVRKGKGGKFRIVDRILYPDAFRARFEPSKHDPEQKIFGGVPCRFPEHRFRRQYAQTLYKQLARPVNQLPKNDRYICRRDKRGTVYDRAAMRIVSHELGHSRIDVIAISYL